MHRMGDLAEAEAVYHRALEIYEPALPPDHPYVTAARAGLGELLADLGRPAEAEAYLRPAATE